jgi:hypothetical protein
VVESSQAGGDGLSFENGKDRLEGRSQMPSQAMFPVVSRSEGSLEKGILFAGMRQEFSAIEVQEECETARTHEGKTYLERFARMAGPKGKNGAARASVEELYYLRDTTRGADIDE